MTFAPDVLDRLRTTEEVDIETRRAPDAPAHRTIIWIVVDERDRVLIRSYLGPRGRWYREALAHPECTIWIGDEAVPVVAEPAADEDRVGATSAGLTAKYPRSGSLAAMLVADVLETTLELLPR